MECGMRKAEVAKRKPRNRSVPGLQYGVIMDGRGTEAHPHRQLARLS